MIVRAQGTPASTRLSIKHRLHTKTLLENAKLMLAAKSCLRGVASTSKAASTPQQLASLVRAGLTASTRHAAAHKSRAARLQATAQKRSAPPETLLAQMMVIGQALRPVQKRRSRQPRFAPSSRKTTQPGRLRAAAREAQQARSRAQRALTLAQRRAKRTEAPHPAAQTGALQEDQIAGQAQASSQARSAGSEQDQACLNMKIEAQPGHQSTPQRSRAARAYAAAHKKHAHAHQLPAVAPISKQAPHRAQRHASRRLTQSGRLRAFIQEAELVHGRTQSVNALSQKCDQPTMPALSAAEDESVSGTHSSASQKPQQQTLMQADARSVPAAVHQPPCASTEAAQQDTPASQKHNVPAQPQHQHSTGRDDCADQEQSMGSPGMPARAQEQDPPSGVEPPATPQPPCPQTTEEPAGGALQGSPEVEAMESRPAKAAAASGKLGSSTAVPGTSGHGGSGSGSGTSLCMSVQECMHPAVSWDSSPERLPQIAAVRPASRLSTSSSHATLPLPSKPLPCTGDIAGSATTAGNVQPVFGRGPPKPEAVLSSQGCKENPHPKPKKGKSILRPDWSKASPEEAHAWLMYRKVLYSGPGGGAADFQTITLELPTDTLKKRKPTFGNKTFLQIETKPEDDISNVPFKARVANHQLKKLLKRKGGIAPKAGDKDYKWYCRYCKACKGYY